MGLKKCRVDVYSKQERTDETALSGDCAVRVAVNSANKQIGSNQNKFSSASAFRTFTAYMDATSGRLYADLIRIQNATSGAERYPNQTDITLESIDKLHFLTPWTQGNVQVFSIGTNVKIYGVRV